LYTIGIQLFKEETLKFEIKGRQVVRGKAAGKALVTDEPICYLGGVDVKKGIITEVGHPLYGKSIAGKVLVFPTGKGSTGGSYLIYEAAYNGVGPCAMINRNIEQVTAVGCIISEIPVIDRPEQDPITTIKDDDFVEVDADKGIITVTRGENH
jgi:predicted aconitase with swiveling domain